MPRAEVGSTKYLNNKMRSRGLQRLRWYCQVCEKQCPDENGFQCHTKSESHVRRMLLMGENPKNAINDFSRDFQRDFLQLLRTSHGTKAVHVNHFYQDYIRDKNHIHQNATKWKSLTEFAYYLGREGICRVEDVEGKGLHIAWIDNSPEALRRQEAIRKRERMDKGDEEREQKLIEEQEKRARGQAKPEEEENVEAKALQRADGEKVKLAFGFKTTTTNPPTPPHNSDSEMGVGDATRLPLEADLRSITPPADDAFKTPSTEVSAVKASFNASKQKPTNVFATKKHAIAAKKTSSVEPTKKMSEAERIMKEEIQRKRARESSGVTEFGVRKRRIE